MEDPHRTSKRERSQDYILKISKLTKSCYNDVTSSLNRVEIKINFFASDDFRWRESIIHCNKTRHMN